MASTSQMQRPTTASPRAAGSADAPTASVFVVDDHEVLRRGLRQLIDAAPDLEVVGEAGTVADAVDGVVRTAPTVAVLDVVLPDGSGIAACREIRMRAPQVRCLLFTAYRGTRTMLEATVAGASACITKDVHATTVLQVVRRVAAGDCLLDPTWTTQVLERLRTGPDPRS
jgi:two-component system, NarL family, response regulator DevR